MTMEERCDAILTAVRQQTGTDPVAMMIAVARREFVKIHGPEHHVLDGACLLMALHNLGRLPGIDQALQKLRAEGLRMPGAVCGLWGVCGAVTSVGAALAIWEGTGPLSPDGTWGQHMVCTASARRSNVRSFPCILIPFASFPTSEGKWNVIVSSRFSPMASSSSAARTSSFSVLAVPL